MQTLRGEYFIKKDFGFYDSGAIAVVGMVPLYVYELLRRFVWRSIESGDAEMRALYREGLLAAKISQSTLAELLGIEARQTVCKYLGDLRRLGWVRAVTLPSSTVKAYVLGEIVLDTSGRRHEVFYADAWMKDLWDAMTSLAEERNGLNAQPTSLPVEDRIALVRAFVERAAVPDTEGQVGNSAVEGGVNSFDTPVTQARHPLSKQRDTPCHAKVTEEYIVVSKGENDIETTGLPLARQGTAKAMEGLWGEREGFSLSSQSAPAHTSPREVKAPPGSTQYTGGGTAGRYAGTVDVGVLVEQNRAARMQRTAQIAEELAKRDHKLENFKGKAAPVAIRKSVGELDAHWRALMAQHFPDVVQPKWDPKGKEPKLIQGLLAKYDPEIVRDAMTYVAERWGVLRERMFKGMGSPTPGLGLLAKLYDQIVPESQVYTNSAKLVAEVHAQLDKDPYAVLPPELDARYKRAKKDLDALGVKV